MSFCQCHVLSVVNEVAATKLFCGTFLLHIHFFVGIRVHLVLRWVGLDIIPANERRDPGGTFGNHWVIGSGSLVVTDVDFGLKDTGSSPQTSNKR